MINTFNSKDKKKKKPQKMEKKEREVCKCLATRITSIFFKVKIKLYTDF